MKNSSTLRLVIVIGVLALFGIVTFALAAATLGTLNKQYGEIKDIISGLTTTQPSLNSILVQSVRIEDLMNHLDQLQRIASSSGNTRAIGTSGFQGTLDYIENYLVNNAPELNVFRQSFLIKNFTVRGSPTLILSVNGSNIPFIYLPNLPKSDFTYVNYSASINLTQLNLAIVLNNGCNDSDWQNVAGRAALVMAGGTCTYAEKGVFANEKNASALLFYNNGLTSSNLAPVIVRLRQTNRLPALFLSYATGQKLIAEANRTGVSIWLSIELENYSPFNVENICADTKDGNSSETIVIGSHSDSVPAGPGINDNG
jgi:aminopeptidase Y